MGHKIPTYVEKEISDYQLKVLSNIKPHKWRVTFKLPTIRDLKKNLAKSGVGAEVETVDKTTRIVTVYNEYARTEFMSILIDAVSYQFGWPFLRKYKIIKELEKIG